jgi:hypothetical protein
MDLIHRKASPRAPRPSSRFAVFTRLIAGAFCLFSVAASARAQGPGLLPQPMHGGSVKEGQKMNFEFVTGSSEFSLFPLSKMGTPVSPNELQIVVTARPLGAAPLGSTKDALTRKASPTANARSEKSQEANVQTSQTLQTRVQADHFLFAAPSFKEPYELTIVASVRGQSESFLISVKR